MHWIQGHGAVVVMVPTFGHDADVHVDAELYDESAHGIEFVPGTHLAGLCAPDAATMVKSLHHQAVDRLGGDLVLTARSAGDGVVEAVRGTSSLQVSGLQ